MKKKSVKDLFDKAKAGAVKATGQTTTGGGSGSGGSKPKGETTTLGDLVPF
jgi:hypothetical protein